MTEYQSDTVQQKNWTKLTIIKQCTSLNYNRFWWRADTSWLSLVHLCQKCSGVSHSMPCCRWEQVGRRQCCNSARTGRGSLIKKLTRFNEFPFCYIWGNVTVTWIGWNLRKNVFYSKRAVYWFRVLEGPTNQEWQQCLWIMCLWTL